VWLGKQHRGQPRFVARKKGEFRPISGREDAEGEGEDGEGEGVHGEIIFTTEAQSTQRLGPYFLGFSSGFLVFFGGEKDLRVLTDFSQAPCRGGF